MYKVFCYLLLLVFSLSSSDSQNITEDAVDRLCMEARSCKTCIQKPRCTWCADNRTDVGRLKTRCRTRRVNEERCPGLIENPQNDVIPTKDEPFSVINDSAVINTENTTIIQLKPQVLDLKLRKDVPQKVNITFRRVIDYPLDLYYVMDLSYSMKDDLTRLQKLGRSLVQRIRELSSNVRLGFGSFVDKVMLPFASTISEQIKDPCFNNENDTCAPVFGFRHQLSITPNGTAFMEAVSATNISGNIDNPEGGFDALMQIAVCQKEIQWREDALRVILFTSDASPHIALDGKLAAILNINDMKCHLKKNVHPYLHNATLYAGSKTMDYPSIGQLKKAFEENKIQAIFAVTQEVLPLYHSLPNLLENSYVGLLASDSSNVISIISTSYNALRSKIQLTKPVVPDNIQMQYRVLCPGYDWHEGLECKNVSIGDEVTFQFEFTSTDCPSARASDVINISSNSIRDSVSINIDYLCECNCSENEEANSSSCSSNGNLQCGVCSCYPGTTGVRCQCTASTTGVPLEANCSASYDSEEPLCSSHGSCECGVCDCDEGYYEHFCQCSHSGCHEDENGACGGKSKGYCVNCNNHPECICNELDGWTLNKDTSLCTCNDIECRMGRNESADICQGRGTCQCDTCSCNPEYNGIFCQNCIHPVCVPYEGICSGLEIQTCAECIYEKGRLNQEIAVECASVCQDFGIKFRSVDRILDCNQCLDQPEADLCSLCNTISTDPSVHLPQECTSNPFSTCVMKYKIVWDKLHYEYIIFVRTFTDEDCPKVNALTIVLPVVLGILFIGILALVIWKVITNIRDKQEYQKFVQETSNAKWGAGESKLYVNPNARVTNPMFVGKT